MRAGESARAGVAARALTSCQHRVLGAKTRGALLCGDVVFKEDLGSCLPFLREMRDLTLVSAIATVQHKREAGAQQMRTSSTTSSSGCSGNSGLTATSAAPPRRTLHTP